MLSTYALQTDESTWKNANVYDPTRFEGIRKDGLGYMTQKGFAPFGVDAPDFAYGGRPCYGRYGASNILRTAISKLLRDYEFVANGRGYFDLEQSCGAAT